MAGVLSLRFLVPPSSLHTQMHTTTPPCTSLIHPAALPPQLALLLLLLPPDLSLPQLLPPGLAQSLQEASQLPLLSPAAKKEKQAKEENKTSGTPRKAIWVILFKRLEVIAAIYTGKKKEEEKKRTDLISIPTSLKEMKLNKLRIRKELQ